MIDVYRVKAYGNERCADISGFEETSVEELGRHDGAAFRGEPITNDLSHINIKVVRLASADVIFFGSVPIISDDARAKVFSKFLRDDDFIKIRLNGNVWWMLVIRDVQDVIDWSKSMLFDPHRKTSWRLLKIDAHKVRAPSIFRCPEIGSSTIFMTSDIVDEVLAQGLGNFVFHNFTQGWMDENGAAHYPKRCSWDVMKREQARVPRLRFPKIPAGASLAEVAAALALPDFYVKFLGAYPDACRLMRSPGPDPKKKIAKVELFADIKDVIKLNKELWQDAETCWSEDLPENKWPREFIAIGEDKCGNYFLVKSGDESGPVWFYNHDGGTFTRRYAHIDDFVKELVEGRYKAPFGPF